jgi:hypothetical protein
MLIGAVVAAATGGIQFTHGLPQGPPKPALAPILIAPPGTVGPEHVWCFLAIETDHHALNECLMYADQSVEERRWS